MACPSAARAAETAAPTVTPIPAPPFGSWIGTTNLTTEWKAGRIGWYHGAESYFTVTRADVSDRQWVLDHPFFIILNLAIGGQVDGPIGLETVFPAHLYMDYVRVYQAADP